MNSEESSDLNEVLQEIYFNIAGLATIVDRCLSQIDTLRGQVKTLESKVEFLNAAAWGATVEDG